MKRLVSVIITTYGNRESFLLEAIESVKKQTYDEIEILLIDDNGIGSEYQKKNEILFLEDKEISYIPNLSNFGVQYSRNIGILMSKGEYIAFLDDDDIWEEEKIEKQVKYLEEKDVDMVFCNGYRFFNNSLNKRSIYQENFIEDKLIPYELLLIKDKIGSTSNPLIKKKCFANSGLFDTEMPARQDYEMWLRIAKKYKIIGLNKKLWYYRYHNEIRITRSLDKELRSYKILYKKYKEDYSKNSQAKANILLTQAITYFKMKRYIFFILKGFNSFVINPTIILSFLKKYKRGRMF